MTQAKITEAAAKLILKWAEWAQQQIGPGFVPVIMWKVDESGREEFTPELTLGFVEHEKVDPTRVMSCNDREIQIYQYLPDEIFSKGDGRYIDRREDKLVFSEGKLESDSKVHADLARSRGIARPNRRDRSKKKS